MSHAIFPLTFATGDLRLLTAIFLGFLFGLSLERGGFGNARKLAAQFYLYDMTVFKVMFTAILVAMVGLYTLVSLGLMDLSLLWINPTFIWAQVVGGFVMGAGFVMSGLCPGTSVVSAASGRWDAVATMLGIFVGTAVFAVAVDFVPGVNTLYHAGSLDVSLLSNVFHLPPLVFALVVVVVAAAGFVGAEKLEEIFSRKYAAIELAPAPRPKLKLALTGAFALVALVGLGLRASTTPTLPQPAMASLAPLRLAEAIIDDEPGILILDVRPGAATADKRIPGSYPADTPEAVQSLLATAPVGSTVVVVDADGTTRTVPSGWRRNVDYAYLQGGFQGWETDVLTPATPGSTESDREWAARQGQIAAYFSGAAVQAVEVSAPPALAAASGGQKPKKKGGC
ncbi:MAG: YeeE/YedE family protein [Gemmatimonadetes bacterium]|nr:YeeE/YedE family protein [Gemmatimonadota bacterium]